MKIRNTSTIAGTTDVNVVKFGTAIELIEKPEDWPGYTQWQRGDLFMLTSEYYHGNTSRKKGSCKRDYGRALLIINFTGGRGYPLKQNTRVIERHDIVVCSEE